MVTHLDTRKKGDFYTLWKLYFKLWFHKVLFYSTIKVFFFLNSIVDKLISKNSTTLKRIRQITYFFFTSVLLV
jgi:hypothetical protein